MVVDCAGKVQLQESWGPLFNSFPSFIMLSLRSLNITGPLPPGWGSSFDHLQLLNLYDLGLLTSIPEGVAHSRALLLYPA